MIKAKAGRTRYILFRISGQASRSQIIGRMRAVSGDAAPWLTVYDGTYGIIRCKHYEKDQMRQLLESIGWAGSVKNRIKISTLATSGTIKKLKRSIQ
jgi:RNase P/RNase MRP subunit POP5